MGFEHCFVKIKKDTLKKLREMNSDEIAIYAKENKIDIDYEGDTFSYVGLSDLLDFDKNKVFNLGKLYSSDASDRIIECGSPLFENTSVQEYTYGDNDLFVIGKQGLIETIQIYKEKIVNYLEDDLNRKNIDRFVSDSKSKLALIDYMIDLDENSQKLTKSWLYEYSIFNLVYLLKTIDWNEYDLILYGG